MSSISPSVECKTSAEAAKPVSLTSAAHCEQKTRSENIYVILKRERVLLLQEKSRITDCLTKVDVSDCCLFKAAMSLSNQVNPTPEDYKKRKTRILGLIRQGKNLKSNDGFGLNPIAYAACQGHRKVVKYFLEYLAKRDIKEFNLQAGMAVYYASLFGDTEVIAQVFMTISENTSRLNKGGIHPKQFMTWSPDSNHTTALELCVLLNEENHTRAAAMLLNNDAALEIRNPMMIKKEVSFCALAVLFPNEFVLRSLLQRNLSMQGCINLLETTFFKRDIETLDILISTAGNARIGRAVFLEIGKSKITMFRRFIDADWMEAIKLMAPPNYGYWGACKRESSNYVWSSYEREQDTHKDPHHYLEAALTGNKLRALVGLAYWEMGIESYSDNRELRYQSKTYSNSLQLILNHAKNPRLVDELFNSGYLSHNQVRNALKSVVFDAPPKNIEILLNRTRKNPDFLWRTKYSCEPIQDYELELLGSNCISSNRYYVLSRGEEHSSKFTSEFVRDMKYAIMASKFADMELLLQKHINYYPLASEVIDLLMYAKSSSFYKAFPMLLKLFTRTKHHDLTVESITGTLTLHCTKKEEQFIQYEYIKKARNCITSEKPEKATFERLRSRLAATVSSAQIPVTFTMPSWWPSEAREQTECMMVSASFSSPCFQDHLYSLVCQVSSDMPTTMNMTIPPSSMITKFEEWRGNYLEMQKLFECFSRDICKIIDGYLSDSASFISECCPSLIHMEGAPEPLSYFFSVAVNLLPELYFAVKAEENRREKERMIKAEQQKLLLHTYPASTVSLAASVHSVHSEHSAHSTLASSLALVAARGSVPKA